MKITITIKPEAQQIYGADKIIMNVNDMSHININTTSITLTEDAIPLPLTEKVYVEDIENINMNL